MLCKVRCSVLAFTGFIIGTCRSSPGTNRFQLNLFLTNGLSHPYHLDGSIVSIFISFFEDNHVSKQTLVKQNSPRRDAAFYCVPCGVASGAILFAYVP